MSQRRFGWTLVRMETGASDRSSRRARCFRITVRGELTQSFVEPLERVVVESSGAESILRCDVADQAKLQAVLTWLYAHGVEILSVTPNDNGADPSPLTP